MKECEGTSKISFIFIVYLICGKQYVGILWEKVVYRFEKIIF